MKNWDKKQAKKQLNHYSTIKLYKYDVDIDFRKIHEVASPLWDEIKDWLLDNIGEHNYIIFSGYISFHREHQAMAFKITWGEYCL